MTRALSTAGRTVAFSATLLTMAVSTLLLFPQPFLRSLAYGGDIRDLTVPDGAELLVGGNTAANVDSLDAIGEQLPAMIAILIGATLVLMFVAFGSIVLPIKAAVMAAVVFGLSTDYEVFLLSRIVEAHDHGASTEDAVKIGLARSGRVITAAALLLIVVTGAFALSGIQMMRFIGVGMIFALALDATIIRMLLVPALLRLLGSANWWLPGPLRRFAPSR